MRIARTAWIALVVLVLAAALQWLHALHPIGRQDLPWTRLDLRAPIGLSTGRKLAALADDPQRCRALLGEARVGFRSVPDRQDGPACGWSGAVRLASPDRPPVILACPLAAAVEVWMRNIVQPAAVDLLGGRVARIETFGSYACRRVRGGADGGWSKHASANAIDVAGVRLVGGRRITVARDWSNGARGRFLHALRDGGCRLFATTLSPDYNAAHRDHLHLDEARRGQVGWRVCA